MDRIKIKHGELGYLLYIDGVKVNFSDSEFCSITALRKYWNRYRELLLSGFRHKTLLEYIQANARAGN